MESGNRSNPKRVWFLVAAIVVVASVGFVTVRSLPHEVLYRGQIGAPSGTVPPFERAPSTPPSLRIAVAGDVGTAQPGELATAALMADAGVNDPYDALILLGDNVYPNGDPTRLTATVFEPFAPILLSGAELLGVLGNHDVDSGHALAQVELLGMPGRWYSWEEGGVLVIVLDSNIVGDPSQTAWLELTLAGSDATWVIVAMHHPAFSAGWHGSTSDVRNRWVPLFEEYGVDLVLAGHDHDYQRTNSINGVTYVVSGAGALTRLTDAAEYTAYSAAVLHFVDLQVWPDQIVISAVYADGIFDLAILSADE